MHIHRQVHYSDEGFAGGLGRQQERRRKVAGSGCGWEGDDAFERGRCVHVCVGENQTSAVAQQQLGSQKANDIGKEGTPAPLKASHTFACVPQSNRCWWAWMSYVDKPPTAFNGFAAATEGTWVRGSHDFMLHTGNTKNGHLQRYKGKQGFEMFATGRVRMQ